MKTRRRFPYLSAALALCGVLLLSVCLAGCGRFVQRKAEDQLNALLPEYLGRADSYQTRVDGGMGAIMRGHIRQVHVTGQNVQLQPDLPVQTLNVDLEDVSVDTKAKTLESVGRTTFTAVLTGEATTRYIKAHRPDLRDAEVVFGANHTLEVTAHPKLLGFSTLPITIVGMMAPRAPENQRLDFVAQRMKLSVVPIPHAITTWIASNINPVIDLSTMRVPVQVQQVTINANPSQVILSGTIRGEDLVRLAHNRPL